MGKDYLGRPTYNAALNECYLSGVQGRNILKWAQGISGYASGGIAYQAADDPDYGGRISGSTYNLRPGELVLIQSIAAALTSASDTLCVHMVICSDYDGAGDQVQICPCYNVQTGTAPQTALAGGFKEFSPRIAVAGQLWFDGDGQVKYPHGKSVGMYLTTNDADATVNCSWAGITLGDDVWGLT